MADKAGTHGSRFAVLKEAGTEERLKKDKKDKDKKSKKEKSQDPDQDCAEEADKKDRKSKKDKTKDKDRDTVAEDDTESHRALSKERKTKDAEAFHTIIVTRLSRAFERYNEKDCEDAAQWLGIDLDPAALLLPTSSNESQAKLWPRMLKHMASAVDEDLVPCPRLVELWDLGMRLLDDAVHCEEGVRLQSALESKFEQDDSFREEVRSREASKKQPAVKQPPAVQEPALAEQPLELFGRPPTGSGHCKMPETVLYDEGRRCFSFRWPGLLRGDASRYFFEELCSIAPWVELARDNGVVKRSTCWYVRAGCSCTYTYSSERVGMPSAEESEDSRFLDLMEELTEEVFKAARPDWLEEDWPNSANLNLYSDGQQAVGWHADDESLFLGREHDCLIVSLSLGATREFWLAPQRGTIVGPPRPDTGAINWMHLEDGDLMTMEGLCQKHYVHCVPSKRKSGPRVNVTWRWIREHKRHCPLGEGVTGRSFGRKRRSKGEGKGKKGDGKGEKGDGKGNAEERESRKGYPSLSTGKGKGEANHLRTID
ncbi:unnamed protein product [Polarella glacialis]|uniref:Fe2OG dioxygenase domain-containing protein n=1 Tax=Polarella glacialis TaxID=89957 RepID=A0A813FHL0_POLGL|nr:unnamed protein product [Polarella glacialis]CAE8678439.1 unnamed protein product [Polarella glacialis]